MRSAATLWPTDAEAPQVGDAGLQLGIDGSCEPGMYIWRIHPDGTLECTASIEQAPAHPGGNCPEGEYLRGISEDGGLLCEPIPLAKASLDAGPPAIEGSCADGGFIQSVSKDGTVKCGVPSLDCATEVSDPPTSVEPGGELTPPLEVECASGYTAVGGGLEILGGSSDDSLNQVLGSYPAADAASWICRYHNESASVSASVACRARCCRLQ